MAAFFDLIRNFYISIFAEFDKYPLSIGDYRVSLSSLIFAFLAICLVVSVFWKGARA